jgi:hypothetical protein
MVMIRARLATGEIVVLPKDCECLTHDGPHWIHMDKLAQETNHEYLQQGMTGCELALRAYIQEERARLRNKLYNMERLGISEILD